MSHKCSAIQGDSPEVRRLCLPKIHYFIFDYIAPTDKMAELFFNFGRKMADKNLVSPKKSSTFVASKEKEMHINWKSITYIFINNLNIQNYEKNS